MARTAKPWEQLTDEQRINRERNKKAKEKRMNKQGNIFTIAEEETAPKPSKTPKSLPKQKSLSNWSSIGNLFLHPFTTFYGLSIISLSSYLVYQFHLHADFTTGLTVEFLAIVFSSIFSMSRGFSKYFSFVCALAVIGYSSVCLHNGMSSTAANNSELMISLKEEKGIVMDQIKTTQQNIKKTPSDHTTRINKMNDSINNYKTELVKINASISSFTRTVPTNYADTIIRCLCMIANMLLIHMTINFLRRVNV
mgnify:FL=1